MDLAQSILKELITLQKKNEELARIITKLEHESDIIIHQFEKKIEELQKDLKHEQDEKSRSARRYESEIKELEGSKDALIQETASVRETFQTLINQLEEKIEGLLSNQITRENDFTALLEEKEISETRFSQEIESLKSLLAKQEVLAQEDHETLSSTILNLEETLHQEQQNTSVLLQQKEREIFVARDALKVLDNRIRTAEDQRIADDEQTRQTIDHLHHLIATERQIRTRELKERDLLVTKFENDLKSAYQDVEEYRTKLHTEVTRYESDVTRFQNTIEELQQKITRLEISNNELASLLKIQSANHEHTLKELNEDLTGQKELSDDQIRSLKEELTAANRDHESALQSKDDQLNGLRQEIITINESNLAESDVQKAALSDLSGQISVLKSEIQLFNTSIQGLEQEKLNLEQSLKDSQSAFDREMAALRLENTRVLEQALEAERVQRSRNETLKDELDGLTLEKEKITSAMQDREEYYREQISVLNRELSDIQTSLKQREDKLTQGQIQRDRHINELSTNNEALRVEIDRVRTQYIRLQETIRAEKEESVHALYRGLTTLEDRLHEKEREVTSLSEKVLRLDAENTRLIQNSMPVVTQHASDKQHYSLPVTPPVGAPHPLDPRKREVAVLTADLEDPARAAEAAEKLAGLGNDIVDLLIPLLHTGSIQRKVWIAVVLYEINDNRATLPLMKLLETPKVHFRELIWEAKNQLHTRSRAGISSLNGSFTPGMPGLGSVGKK